MLITDYSQLHRSLLVVFSFICCIGTAGVIFGFASLKPVLQAAGVYRDLCPEGELTCPEQNVRLSLMFTVASSATNIAALLIGFVLDHCGPKVSMISGSVLFGMACVSMIVSFEYHVDLYIVGYTLFALGGPFIFLSTLHLSCAIPALSNLIMAALTSAFDISSLVFFLFNKVYFATDGKFGISQFFGVYLAIPVCAFLVAVILMPWSSFKAESIRKVSDVSDGGEEGLSSETQSLLKASSSLDSIDTLQNGERLHAHLEQDRLSLVELGLWKQAKSYQFILLVLFMCVYMLRFNFFIGSLPDFLASIGDDISTPLSVFGILLPIGPLIAIFVTTWLLGKSFAFSYAVLFCMNIAFSALNLTPYTQVQYGAFVLFVLMRSMLYALANQFCAKVFGFVTFGKIYGSMMLICGMFNFSQYIVINLAISVFDGNYFYPNVILTTLCVSIGSIFPFYLILKTK